MARRERERFLIAVVITLLMFALFHLLYYFASYGTGIAGFGEKGISGLSIKKLDENKNEETQKGSLFSKLMIVFEWILVGAVFLFISVRRRMFIKEEAEEISARKNAISSVSKTDIDKLYEILKEKKRIRISAVAKAFNVSKDVVLEWGQILESGGLAIVNYPRIGEAEVVLQESTNENVTKKN